MQGAYYNFEAPKSKMSKKEAAKNILNLVSKNIIKKITKELLQITIKPQNQTQNMQEPTTTEAP